MSRKRISKDQIYLDHKKMPPHASIRDALLSERDRTGVGPTLLLNGARDIPHGLNANKAGRWLSGWGVSARKDHIEYLLRRWRALPAVEYVQLTSEIVRTLRTHKDRSGVGAHALLKHGSLPPQGLNAAMVENWFSGTVKSAQKRHLDYMLAAYESLPTDHTEDVAITPALRRELSALRRRTGIGPAALLSRQPDKPEGLKAAIIRYWLDGTAKRARKDYLDYALKRWRSLPVRFDR